MHVIITIYKIILIIIIIIIIRVSHQQILKKRLTSNCVHNMTSG